MKISAGATDSQFILHGSQAESQQVVVSALTKLGGIKSSTPGNIKGWGKYGLNKVSVDISFLDQGNETLMTINAKNESVSSGPNKSFITRLVDAVANSDNTSFVPDKQGIGTAPLLASLGGLVIVVLIVVPIVLYILF